jgi:hypothetical protein
MFTLHVQKQIQSSVTECISQNPHTVMHGLYHAFLTLLNFRLESAGQNTMGHIVPRLQYVVCNRYSAARN